MPSAGLAYEWEIAPAMGTPLVSEPIGVLAILLAVLAMVFLVQDRPRLGRLFKVIPAIAFCYFLPTALTSVGVLPSRSDVYDWVKEFLLPASLLLLTLSLDIPAILRLGPKALIMFLTATVGIIIGGPLSLAIWQGTLPPDAWQAMSYLAGTWIGGSANGIATQMAVGASDAAIAPLIIVDIAVGYSWMGLLLFLAGRSGRVDAWFRADASGIAALQRNMEAFHARVAREARASDWIVLLALAFGVTWLGHVAGGWLMSDGPLAALRSHFDPFACKLLVVTAVGISLSFTGARRLEGVGASRLGGTMLYLLIACIGAGADFAHLPEAGPYLAVGATWMLIHAVGLAAVGRLIRAPFFYLAVGSQANIGGAASAPVVAAAFSPVLAPVGVLLAIAGYALGTVCGVLTVQLCRWVQG